MSDLNSNSHSSDQAVSSSSARFRPSRVTAEELLRSQTEGLVSLSDYRKRRREAIELNDSSANSATPSGANTPLDGAGTPVPVKKKKTKKAGRIQLSYDDEEEEDDDSDIRPIAPKSRSISRTPDVRDGDEGQEGVARPVKKLGARVGTGFVPKARTKAALAKEAEKQEQLRKEFIATRELVKKTDVMIPFVFYDGAVTPGGKVRVKKGDPVWRFLDKARKVGAELGVGGVKASSQWARVSVDDLLMVKDDIIIPHHYEFYYFAANQTLGYRGPLFNLSAAKTAATPAVLDDEDDDVDLSTYDPLQKPNKKKEPAPLLPLEQLEGFHEDASRTKLVDRRWYEKHKHIYPASLWQEFDPTKDYSTAKRTDAQGNTFFQS